MAGPSATQFFGYPKAVKAPEIPYLKQDDANPVFRGTLLVIGAWLVTKLTFVQRYLWANAGFGGLRNLGHLKDYAGRSDPTVIPITSQFTETDSSSAEQEETPGLYRSVIEYHQLYLSGKLTPLAVAEYLLPLCRRDIDTKSHHATAFIHSNHEAILQAAKESTARYRAGLPLSVMDGVPTAVKDESDVAGYRTTQGRKKNDTLHTVAEESSWPVQKIEEAGGIIMGKLNMHELGADTTNNNPNWGTPLNPHNSQYYTGGSSGGPAYVVSSGLVPFAIGSDGGGSIRIPASFCGIYGLKPSHGRLEDTKSTVTVTGPLAANMSSLESAWRIISVPNASDPVGSLFAPPRRPITPPKVIGIHRPWFNRADPSVLKICNEAIAYYETKLGYKVVDITLPYVPEGQLAHALTILSEMAIGARDNPHDPSNWLSGLNPANKVLLAVGDQTPARDYLLAQQLRNMLMQHLAYLYSQYPGLVIVTPTTPMAGWPIASPGDLKHGITDGNMSIRNMEYVWLANFCGNPAISCPVGYVDAVKGDGRIPVGLMAMGEWGAEEQLILWGKECEAMLKEGRVMPGNWVDVAEDVKGVVVKENGNGI